MFLFFILRKEGKKKEMKEKIGTRKRKNEKKSQKH